jgi:hypothetical protein
VQKKPFNNKELGRRRRAGTDCVLYRSEVIQS